ncbi:MAG: thiolase family protein [Fibrobacterales bacterium]
MKERIAIIDGLRTPFCKAGTDFNGTPADDLGAHILKELLERVPIDPHLIDEVIIGNVGQPSDKANIARIIAIKAGLPLSIPAYTVNRNCASGFESLTTATNKILAGEASIMIVGGAESMSNYPLLFNSAMTKFFGSLQKAKGTLAKLKTLSTFRLSHLKPDIAVIQGLTDPTCSLNMGQTAEVLVREFGITREEQDRYAMESHHKAAKAQETGILAEELIPTPNPPSYKNLIDRDTGIRAEQNMKALGKLRPVFEPVSGSVTPGNACPLTDGAGMLLIMTESRAKELNLTPLGYLSDYSYAGLPPNRMGLGPVYSTAKLLQKTGLSISDIDLIEMNEAFASQIIGNLKAFESDDFSKHYLHSDTAVGAIDPDIINVNGGAIAIGHPVGATGTRLVLTLLKELKRRGAQRGIATLCIGGGQGGALLLEVDHE